MPTTRRLDDTTEAAIIAERNAGRSLTAIANAFGISRSLVWHVCERANGPAVRAPQVRFGIEIECRRPQAWNHVSRDSVQERVAQALRDAGLRASSESYNHTTRSHWKVIYDASSDIEVVSPPLSGEAGLRDVKTVMRTLRTLGFRVSASEGMHVHVDMDTMTGDDIATLVETYHARQAAFDSIVARNRRTTRGNVFCRGLADREVADIAASFRAGRRAPQYTDRYRTVNVRSFAQYGTVEFRQHQGSLNGSKAVAWVRLVVALREAVRTGVALRTDLAGMVDDLAAAGLLPRRTATFLANRAAALA